MKKLNRKEYLKHYRETHREQAKNKSCPDCGKKIWSQSIRCKSCARIEQYKVHPDSHPFKGKHHTKEAKVKIKKTLKRIWKDTSYRDRVVTNSRKAMHLRPNKPEALLSKLINSLSKDYKYVGDGSFIINGFNPDFINVNGQKKVIELFGTYWHKRPEVIIRDRKRINSYKKYGYKTLVIWEHELKNIEQAIKKITKFV